MKTCPICDRKIIEGQESAHHLIPKTFKGRETIDLHKVCHNQIHALFSERELLNHYHTIGRLKEDERMVKFIKWIRKKPLDFYVKSKMSNRIK